MERFKSFWKKLIGRGFGVLGRPGSESDDRLSAVKRRTMSGEEERREGFGEGLRPGDDRGGRGTWEADKR